MSERKRTIIFVHGSMGCNQVWKYQIQGLSAKNKTIAIDLPGHFGTDCPEMPNMETYVTFLNEKIGDLQLNQVILGGHSMGGTIILSYYFQYPEKVQALILIGTGARLRVLPAILEMTKNNDPKLIQMMETVAFHKNTIRTQKHLIEEVNSNMMKTLPNIGYYDFSICNEFDVMSKLGEIEIPTLIICGDDDKLTPPKYSIYLNEHIPKSTLHIIENAGHMVMLEQVNAVNKVVKEFLSTL